MDEILTVVADGKSAEIGPVMSRLHAQGTNAVTLVIMGTRHFRALHAIAAGAGNVRMNWKQRDAMMRQAQVWGVHKLEMALEILTDTDLQLRSAGQKAPAMALVERALIRLAMLQRR